MKLRSLILLFSFVHICAGSSAQGITLDMEQQPLQNVFAAIKSQAGTMFLYSDKILEGSRPVTIRVKNAALDEVLPICFAGQPVEYSIVNGTVVVKRKQKTLLEKTNGKTITGTVTFRNYPLAGVSVYVENKNQGTVTDIAGAFVLRNIAAGEVLLFSSVGFEKKEVTIGDQSALHVELIMAANLLDQPVIIAYGTTTKRLNTGNVGKVSAAEIERQPVSNPLGGIQGRVAGVYVQQNTGVPGGSFTVQIRGRNSLRTAGNDPLYLVDGVPYPASSISSTYTSAITRGGSPIAFINPTDISSIEILKDADATAIYGSRGANGVVLITTKKAKAGKTAVTVNLSQGIGQVANRLDLLNRRQYLDMRYQAYANDGIDFLSPSVTSAYDLKIYDTTRETDWQKKLIGNTSKLTRGQVSISGGSAATQFLLSGNYLKETTVFPGNYNDEKTSFHFSVNHTGIDKLSVSFSASYLRDQNNLLTTDLTNAAISLIPVAPALFQEDGSINFMNGSFINTPAIFLSGKFRGRASNLVSDARISYSLSPGIELSLNAGYNAVDINERRISPSYAAYPKRPSGNTYFSNNSVKTWSAEPQLNLEKLFSFGKISLLTGVSMQQSFKDGNTFFGTGFSSDALLENILAASEIYIFEANETDYRYQALFARLNYNYKDRYILNLTGRRDGSSRFGPGKQFANFGAMGAGWIFSRDPNIAKLFPFLSYGKIRGSAGITGSDQTGDYGFLDLWNSTSTPYSGSQGLYPNSLFNPLYSWETNKKLEAGIEVGILKDKMLFSVSHYRNRSSDQLVGLPLSAVTGFTSIQYNLPAVVQNQGWEIELSGTPIQTKKFEWSSSANITMAKNKLVDYPGLASSIYNQTYFIGEPLGARKIYASNGINPESGLFEVKDLNHDGAYALNNDGAGFVNTIPTAFGGWENNLAYAGVELSVFIQFVQQRAANMVSSFPAAGMLYNQPVSVLDSWISSAPDKNYQRFSATQGSTAYSRYGQSDGGYSDASFIRLKNISLGYSFPSSIVKRLGAQQIKLLVQAQNLLTFTHYKGLDPETLSLQSLPPLRMIAGSIQLTF